MDDVNIRLDVGITPS